MYDDYHTRQATKLGALRAVVELALAHIEGTDTLISREIVLHMLRGALAHDGSDDFWSRHR